MKRVLITGGATGIGKACAVKFKENGYDVFITYNKTKPELGGVTAVKCNLENVEEIKGLFEKYSSFDVLVNNAGVSLIKQINDTDKQDYDSLMNVNARSYFFCCKYALDYMLKNHAGAIVNISSMWGQLGASCEVAYSMSKAAVIGLTKALSQELALSNISVNCVCPGIIDTRMNNMFDKKELENEVPMGRLGTPEEVAQAVLFLSQSSYVTGQILGVNGGIV